MRKLRVGVIGTGSISEQHLAGYRKDPAAEIVALCDINEARLALVGKQHPAARMFTDYHEMLAMEELDAVSVCAWNSMHAPCAIAALQAGKHVLCEKPMALNTAQAREMQAAAAQSGKLLMIGFVRRFGNDCVILKDYVDRDYFGDIYYAKASYLRRSGCPGGWFGNKALAGGGPLIDLGVHVIDLSRYLMGNPRPVSVFGATFNKLGRRSGVKGPMGYQASSATEDDIFDVEDLATAMVRYENGAVLHIDAAFSLNLKEEIGRIELFGSKMGAKIDPEVELYADYNGYMANLQLTVPTALSFEGLFEGEISHFVDCALNGTPCRAPAEDGVAIMRILDAIYQSAQTGHEVVIEQAG